MITIVDWTTLMFFLPIVIGAVTDVGVVNIIADTPRTLVGSRLAIAFG